MSRSLTSNVQAQNLNVEPRNPTLENAADEYASNSHTLGFGGFGTQGPLPLTPTPRIHNDTTSHRAAAGLNARAFTLGKDIYFGKGQYQPHTPEGRNLIAHETAHTTQPGAEHTIRRKPLPGKENAPMDLTCLTAIALSPEDTSGLCGEDTLLDAFRQAIAATTHPWSRGVIKKLLAPTYALRNILIGPFDHSLAPGENGHPDTYKPLKLEGAHQAALKALFTALHGDTPLKDKIAKLKSAQSGASGIFRQLEALGRSKALADNSQVQQLITLVHNTVRQPLESILEVWTAMQAALTPPKKPKEKTSSGEGMPKGYNRQKREANQLPGLGVDPDAPAPLPDTLAASVEANMARDLALSNGGEDDFLYLNVPELVAGHGASSTARTIWHTLYKERRARNLSTLYGKTVTQPDDPTAQAAFEGAMKGLEDEHGKWLRDLAVTLWVFDLQILRDLVADANVLAGRLRHELQAISSTGSRSEAMDAKTAKEHYNKFSTLLTALRERESQLSPSAAEKQTLDALSKSVKSGWETLGAIATGPLKENLRTKWTTQLEEDATAIESATTGISPLLPEWETRMQGRYTKYKDAIDRVRDPKRVPLFRPVKRQDVTVTIKGQTPEDNITAYWGTKPESSIGIYEDVWGPAGITDKKGSFDSGGDRSQVGKGVYEKLKGTYQLRESEAKVLATVACGEGNFHDLNSVDMMRISLGFIQFAGISFVKLLTELKSQEPGFFQSQFEQYGILIRGEKEERPPVTARKKRFVPGASVGKPVEDGNPSGLIVYDHVARQWVEGLEALAVLQSDPRYMTLIRASGKFPEMQAAQVMRALNSYHIPTRTNRIPYDKVGLPKTAGADGSDTFAANAVLRNEAVAYIASQASIGAGVYGDLGGVEFQKKLIRAVVAAQKIDSYEALLQVPQKTFADAIPKALAGDRLARLRMRMDTIAKGLGQGLSEDSYDGAY